MLYIPPISAKFIHSPISAKCKFLLNLCLFASSYFEHDAFMHHALHVLDAPEC